MSSFVGKGSAVPEKIFEGVFTIYGHGSHLCQVTWFIYKYIDYPFTQMFPIKFDFDWPSAFRKNEYYDYYGFIHVYCPGMGTDPRIWS